MPNGNELNPKCRYIRVFLLVLYVPICVMLLFSAIYATKLTVETWSCKKTANFNVEQMSNISAKAATNVKCYTILDALSSNLSKYIADRKIVLVLRTVSLCNTFLTYLSAMIATYKLSILPLIWLSFVSIASFFVTLNISIIYGPLSGINNFEVVPILLGIKAQPYIITAIVLAIDLIISVMALTLVINNYKKRSH